MTTARVDAQPMSEAVSVMVVENDHAIRGVLLDLLEDEGYSVVSAENLHEATILMDDTSVPMVLLIGDASVADYGSLEFFTTVAANPIADHAYIYLTSTPERLRLPALVQVLETIDASTIEKPFELDFLLDSVADAAFRLHG